MEGITVPANKSYDDIINLPRHQSATHAHMSNHDRAAQFAPFAALTGYGDAVTEAARLTDRRIELDEDGLEQLNERLNWLQEHLSEQPEVSILCFTADKKKAGGCYHTLHGIVKRIDEYEKLLLLQDGRKLPLKDILEIQ